MFSDKNKLIKTLLGYIERFDANKVAIVERNLNLADRISLIYLLYDDPNEALNCLTTNLHCKTISKWCEDLTRKKQREWKLRVLESLYLMQNFKCLKKLGFNKRDLADVMNVLDKTDRKPEFDYRKLFYTIFDSLSCDDLEQIIEYIDMTKSNGYTDIFQPKYIEIYLLKWQINGKLNATRQDVDRILKIITNLGMTPRFDLDACNFAKLQSPQIQVQSSIESKVDIHCEHPQLDTTSKYYPIIDSNNVGLCIIVNQENYTCGHQPRRGSQYDVGRLQETMTKMKITCINLSNLNHNDIFPSIEERVNTFFNPVVHSVLLVVIMAHGSKDHLFGVDGIPVETNMIRDSLSRQKCPGLCDKPKVIIFQCCRGNFHYDTKLEADGPGEQNEFLTKASMDDYIIGWATLPGFKAYRSPESGSLYIQTLCDILDSSYKSDDICNILSRVRREFNDKRFKYYDRLLTAATEYHSGLSMKLYFYKH